MRCTIVASLWVVLTVLPPAFADPPRTIIFEGQLRNVSGDLLHGEYDVLFTIYDKPVDGEILWREMHGEVGGFRVPLDSGWYLVELGVINPIPDSVVKNPGRWLGVKVGNDPEISPRTGLMPGARAYRVTDRMISEEKVRGRYDCTWQDRGSPRCRGYGISEWGVMFVTNSALEPRQRSAAVLEMGFVRTLSANTGLGATVYLATGKEWRVGPRLRYRQWLADDFAIDVSSGVTWNLQRTGRRESVEGKIGYAGRIGINHMDKVSMFFEYDIFPMYTEWDTGSRKSQRVLCAGCVVGAKGGMSMIACTVLLVLSFLGG